MWENACTPEPPHWRGGEARMREMGRKGKGRVFALARLRGVMGRGTWPWSLETPPVATVLDGRLPVHGAVGDGTLPFAASQDWSKPLPAVTRVVIVVHGAHRDAAR